MTGEAPYYIYNEAKDTKKQARHLSTKKGWHHFFKSLERNERNLLNIRTIIQRELAHFKENKQVVTALRKLWKLTDTAIHHLESTKHVADNAYEKFEKGQEIDSESKMLLNNSKVIFKETRHIRQELEKLLKKEKKL